jgi:uncharacterized SAM-binding protein YcdF (DUF218 family)
MSSEVLSLAQVLWNYNYLGKPVQKADALFLFGHNDLRVVKYAAQVALKHDFRTIICSGGIAHAGEVVDTGWGRPEADVFAETLVRAGVPIEHILLERAATNTGENILFTKHLMESKNLEITSGLLIHKPYMERRALSAVQKQWPGVAWHVNSPPYSLTEYLEGQQMEKILHSLVGDTARLETYAKKGYQLPQPMPAPVKKALQKLINLGYNQHLPKDM